MQNMNLNFMFGNAALAALWFTKAGIREAHLECQYLTILLLTPSMAV
jgi:hypothetical protein